MLFIAPTARAALLDGSGTSSAAIISRAQSCNYRHGRRHTSTGARGSVLLCCTARHSCRPRLLPTALLTLHYCMRSCRPLPAAWHPSAPTAAHPCPRADRLRSPLSSARCQLPPTTPRAARSDTATSMPAGIPADLEVAAAPAHAKSSPPTAADGALPLGSVEKRAPGTFCAELWRSVSQPGGTFRCEL